MASNSPYPSTPSAPNSGSTITIAAPGSEPTSEVGRKSLRRSIAGSALGNAAEWFDYGVYSYLTVYMAANFFSSGGDSGLAVTLTLGTLALSFLVRPLGGIVLGPLGDRIGRQKVMVITIIMMTLATGCIGLLPTQQSVGILAPILLLLCRLLQGFSAGGEYGGAAVYMAECAPDRRRGFFGSFLEFGTTSGLILAAIVCTILITLVGDSGMEAGWWRLPFLLSFPLGLVALWIRTRLTEAPVFSEAVANRETQGPSPLVQVFTQAWRQLLILCGLTVVIQVGFYMVLAYMPTYLSTQLGHSTAIGNWMLVGVMAMMLVLIPVAGSLSDRIGRKTMMLTASAGFTLLSVPAVLLLQVDALGVQLLGLVVLGLLLIILVSSVSSTLPALFPTNIRYTGFALGWNVATALFAGPSQALTNELINKTGNQLIPGWYLTIAGVIGVVSVIFMRETAQASLRGESIPGVRQSVGRIGRRFVQMNRDLAAQNRTLNGPTAASAEATT